MRIRTTLAALALATAGLIGSAGTATADPIFDIEYRLLSPNNQACINDPAAFAIPIEVFSPDIIACVNDA